MHLYKDHDKKGKRKTKIEEMIELFPLLWSGLPLPVASEALSADVSLLVPGYQVGLVLPVAPNVNILKDSVCMSMSLDTIVIVVTSRRKKHYKINLYQEHRLVWQNWLYKTIIRDSMFRAKTVFY